MECDVINADLAQFIALGIAGMNYIMSSIQDCNG